tara:strand:- start:266 stop:571 length:306 start_codon:yes stop_codon:yes gene_type:complete
MGLLIAQDLPTGKSQHPKVKKPFNLSYEDVKHLDTTSFVGNILVEFTVDTEGKVIEPNIVDTFNIKLNEAVIDKVMCLEFKPALQNGKPVKVKYKLPILFK